MEFKLGNLTIKHGSDFQLGPIEAWFENGRTNLVVGKSGCGKTTLLKTIAGFHKEYSGAMIFDNDYWNPEGNVALAFQNPESLFFNSTVFEEISYSLKVSGVPSDVIASRTKAWMEKWGLNPEKYSDKYPFRLSGGEKRRVALAACTIFEPKLILLDEPLAGLDNDGKSKLADTIRSLSEKSVVIIVTHEPDILLDENAQVLYISKNKVFPLSAIEFVSQAMHLRDFYPLPEWYVKAIEPYMDYYPQLPMINADSVLEYYERINNNG